MSEFSRKVVAWQRLHGRHDLPWQNTRDPYRIWLSEIMLQQTQVVTVLGYYERFLEYFPNVAALAEAPVARVLALWAGLGYYARARNLHRCAQEVMGTYGGIFPTEAARLKELPGIGRSTAAAIAAFSVGERAAILDGNVKRVLCRHFAREVFPGSAGAERELWTLAESLLPAADMPAYTQGLMDLGATVCTRSNPRCGECPLYDTCAARQAARQDELPLSKPGKKIPERVATYTLIVEGGRVLLERRPPSGIWGGLLVPPEGEVDATMSRLGLTARSAKPLGAMRHTFTHFRLTLLPVLCVPESLPLQVSEGGWEWLPLAEIETAALPTPIRKLLLQLRDDRAEAV